ncbi:DUF3172 domain-containing protein [Lyngbya sp. PCC 8106]|uniref:DUF3172 domain-containing protein n=1 Tax=Lyngbya sp. (strain PCC 8106) TaxID=313612 RepID=UPI0000EACDD9|nr:DUF3172 domain-containing protein [Lyngbya sp. PCC 8106]EAW35520.1 hypothetical protein L8106_10632 [Lyngbya sp. PCC 8106]
MKRKTRTSPARSTFNYTALAVIGGVLILGIGIGIAISSTTTFSPENVASSQFIDRSAPSTETCIKFGASAMVTDMRVFVTLNPFNVYISQPRMQPGCVLRTSNWTILKQNNLISSEQERDCKQRMNTFGYTGELESSPEISCIYQNNSAENLFLSQPGGGGMTPARPRAESDRF